MRYTVGRNKDRKVRFRRARVVPGTLRLSRPTVLEGLVHFHPEVRSWIE